MKFFSGKVKKMKKKILGFNIMNFKYAFTLALSCFCLLTYADDFGQAVIGDSQIREFEEDLQIKAEEEVMYPSTKREHSGFLEGSVKQAEFESDINEKFKEIDQDDNELDREGSHLIGNIDDSKFSSKNKNDVFGETLDGQFDNKAEYIEYRNDKLLNKKFNLAKSSYSLLIIKNTYEYTDENQVFKRTFEDSDKGHKIGTLHVDYRKYLSKGILNTHIGMGFGIGHSRAKGLFTDDNSVSETTFQVWTFPIDLWLGAEIRMSQFFKLSLAGGPSALPILLSRNDRKEGDDDKEYQQIGTGYSGLLKFQLNWSAFSPDTGFKMLSNYGISNLYFDFLARYQNYDNFKDNIQIAGTSFGIGFSFEYL